MQKIVLIVDDSIPIHTLVKKHLESEPFHLYSIYDGASAVTTAIRVRPDLILLDVDLPRLNGFETCLDLKTNPLTASISFVFLSGNSLVEEKTKGLEMGAMDYIVKPFKADVLRACISSALSEPRKQAPIPPATLEQGVLARPYFDIQLDAQLAEAKRCNRPLSCVVGELDCWGTVNSKMESQIVKEVIRSVAGSFMLTCRPTDTILQLENGRVILLLANRTRYEASKVIDQLHRDIEQHLSTAQNAGVNVTYSFGVADTCMTTGDTLLHRANVAAQRARRRGGNRIAIARAGPALQLAA